MFSENKNYKKEIKYRYVLPDLQMLNINESGEIFENCAICLSHIEARGKLNCCNHLFCTLCIRIWEKKSTLCPICKQKFSKINTEFLRLKPLHNYK